MHQQQRKKATERKYLDQFLVGVGWADSTAAVEEGEGPDFVLVKTDGRRVGVEVRQIFGGDVSTFGSEERRKESLDDRWLKQVWSRYYALGGRPAQVLLDTFPEQKRGLQMDDAFAEQVAKWLVDEAEKIAPLTLGPFVELVEDHRRLASAHLNRLPDDHEPYTRGWRLLNHAVGWVRDLTSELLQPAIDEKILKVKKYRASAPNLVLLLVAEGSYASGMFRRQAPAIDRGPFDSVHLLFAPKEVIQLG